jgi:hypothetical protein
MSPAAVAGLFPLYRPANLCGAAMPRKVNAIRDRSGRAVSETSFTTLARSPDPPDDAARAACHEPGGTEGFSAKSAGCWRTGPTATLLVTVIEYVKLLLPFRGWRAFAHITCGWVLFPLRYMNLLLLRSPDVHRIGNHCYLWLSKPETH